MPDDAITAKLYAAAANAKVLAQDYEHGRLWEGDLESRLARIFEDLRHVSESTRRG